MEAANKRASHPTVVSLLSSSFARPRIAEADVVVVVETISENNVSLALRAWRR